MKSQLHQVSEHVYWFSPDETTDRPTLGAIVGKAATLIVDAGASTKHAKLFLAELSKKNMTPIKYLVLTHWHWDHVFGTAAFDAVICASTQTKQMMAKMAAWDWSDAALDQRVADGIEIEFCRDMIKKELPDRSKLVINVPDLTFDDKIEIDLGGVTCQVVHVGGDHAEDSSIVYVPEEKVLFLSDCLYPDIYHGQHANTTKKLFPLLDTILSFEADHFLWGHADIITAYDDMVAEASLLKTIGKKVNEIGKNREKVLSVLQEMFGGPLDEEQLEFVDYFLAGL